MSDEVFMNEDELIQQVFGQSGAKDGKDEFFEFRPPNHSVRDKFVQTIWHKDIVNYLKENNLYENFIHIKFLKEAVS